MESKTNLIVGGNALKLDYLQHLQLRPAPFAPGEASFWDDPYISGQMLSAHLNPKADAASRRPQTIDREVAWLIGELRLQQGDAVIDLGCGPGLYASRLARRNLRVTGVDYAQRSIAHARDDADRHDLDITYDRLDYLQMDFEAQFDAGFLINGDFCALSPEQRGRLLGNIGRALRPGGRLALDVVTQAFRDGYRITNQWYIAENGFWRPDKHLVLEEGFDYPQAHVFLNQYIIVEADGTTTVYRNWFQTFTPQTITAELEAHGFSVAYLGGNLRGSAYTDHSEWIGVVATKRDA